jgi:hypothetical protein
VIAKRYDRPAICPIDNNRFASRVGLIQHIIAVHPGRRTRERSMLGDQGVVLAKKAAGRWSK